MYIKVRLNICSLRLVLDSGIALESIENTLASFCKWKASDVSVDRDTSLRTNIKLALINIIEYGEVRVSAVQ